MLTADDPALPAEYRLEVGADGILVSAADAVARSTRCRPSSSSAPADGSVPYVTIEDHPRFAYRGAMLDVARHFFTVEEVERYLDFSSRCSSSTTCICTSPTIQGWRIQIDSWPKLTEVAAARPRSAAARAASTTQADYAAIVAYAAERFITIVPEIDLPGHTNAAPSPTPSSRRRASTRSRTRDRVGFSTLCIGRPETTRFVTDVLGEVAAMTPGPYLHIGGDESPRRPTRTSWRSYATRARSGRRRARP